MNKYILFASIFLFSFSCKNEKREEVIIPVLETKKIDTLISQENSVDSTIHAIKKIPTVSPIKSDPKTDIKVKKVPEKIKSIEPNPPSPKEDIKTKEDVKPVLKPESRTNKNEVPSSSKVNQTPNEKKTILPIENKVQQSLDFSSLDQLLQKYVTSTGNVDYAGLKSNKTQLENCIDDLKKKVPNKDWSKNEKLAYWINVYNAFTLKKIVDNYPIKSITDLDGGKPWDKKFIVIGSDTYSLNDIEDDIIRPTFKEPRIHFGVNCAAKSCPPLLNKAFTETNVISLLEQQAKKFITNQTFNTLAQDKIEISKIFEWYAKDFGNIIDYINKYSPLNVKPSAQIKYREYDWSLNGK
jgi:hypothetical protein